VDYQSLVTRPQGLDRLCSIAKETGLTIRLPGGREALLVDVIVDSGSNILIITEDYAGELGLHVLKSKNLPHMRGINGVLASYFVGVTGPFTLVLAQGTPYATEIAVPAAYVIRGDAGGMYKMCLDKQTLLPVLGKVEPRWQHLVWFPKAAEGTCASWQAFRVTSAMAQGTSGQHMAPMAAVGVDQFPFFSCAAIAEFCAAEPTEETETQPNTRSSSCSSESPYEPLAGGKTTVEPTDQGDNSDTGGSSYTTPGGSADTLPEKPSSRLLHGASCSTVPALLRAAWLIPQILVVILWLCWTCLVDGPLAGVPNSFLMWLAACALMPVFSQRPHRCGLFCRLLGPRLASRPRPTSLPELAGEPSRSAQCQGRPSFNLLPLLLRACLFFLLCLLSSAVCITATGLQPTPLPPGSVGPHHATGESLPDGRAQLPGYAMHLLRRQLTDVNISRFAGAAEDPMQHAATQWYKPGPDVLTSLAPDGIPEEPHDATWTVHETGKWILGNHPEATQEQMKRMIAMLESNKAAFAYSLSELPGYVGTPVQFELLDPHRRMFSPQRQYSKEELLFGDEKVQEMLDAGVVKEISTTNPHASCVTLPMKRAPDGSWTDKRFCVDLRAVNANTVVDRIRHAFA